MAFLSDLWPSARRVSRAAARVPPLFDGSVPLTESQATSTSIPRAFSSSRGAELSALLAQDPTLDHCGKPTTRVVTDRIPIAAHLQPSAWRKV
jgi:hypothetical protein